MKKEMCEILFEKIKKGILEKSGQEPSLLMLNGLKEMLEYIPDEDGRKRITFFEERNKTYLVPIVDILVNGFNYNMKDLYPYLENGDLKLKCPACQNIIFAYKNGSIVFLCDKCEYKEKHTDIILTDNEIKKE